METPMRNEPEVDGGRKTNYKPDPTTPGKSYGRLTAALLLAVVFGGAYLVYDRSQLHRSQRTMLTEIAGLSDQLKRLEEHVTAGESATTRLMTQLSETQQSAGLTRQELAKMNRQITLETQKTKAELGRVIASKADNSEVEAVKQEAVAKIEQVSTDVGGVKNEVGSVKTGLASTRTDLEGTQRQLSDVRETLSAAIARNATELAELRRKGERNYVEFEIPRKNAWQKVEDINLALNKTDPKNGKFSIEIAADDSKLEKKDRTINEPMQFLVGRNHVRYELVVNWVQKDRIGGYLSVPKDKVLASELLPKR
jgi:chromosome segregation ATPase